MMANPDNMPRFRVTDRVTVTVPCSYRGKQGLVELVQQRNHHCRYRVRFPDGNTAIFAEFELALISFAQG